jgi:hypothetical protein
MTLPLSEARRAVASFNSALLRIGVLALVSGCAMADRIPLVFLTTDQVAVVLAALQIYSTNPYAPNPYVVQDRTHAFPGIGSQVVLSIPSDAIPKGVVFVRAARIDHTVSGGWSRFYAEFPRSGGLLRVSSPEVTSNEASIIVESKSGMECCGAEEIKFARTSAGWQLVARRILWMF